MTSLTYELTPSATVNPEPLGKPPIPAKIASPAVDGELKVSAKLATEPVLWPETPCT